MEAGGHKRDWLARRTALKKARLSVLKEDNALGSEASFSSIAHSHGEGIAAVSTRPVGVDMEFARPRVCERELACTIAAQKEYAVVRGAMPHSNAPHLLTTIWVIKEAARKVLHDPRPYHPRELTIESRRDTIFLVYDKKRGARMRVLMAYNGGAYVAIAEQCTRACPFAGVTIGVASQS